MKFAGFLLFVITGIIISCSSDQKKVGYLYPSKDRDRFVNEGKYMLEKLKQSGYETMMVDADDNDALQLERGYQMLEEGLDALVIAPVNGTTIAPLVRDAKKRGVKVFAYNRLINNSDYDMFFTGNNKDNGRIFCESALRAKPTGKYVILAGDRFDRNGIELKAAIDSILKPHVDKGDIEILYESYIENWNIHNASFELEDVIQSKGTDIDVIIACSDPMAIGSVEVLKKYHLEGNVFVTGQDALLDAVKNIYIGHQSITIYHPSKVLGYTAADMVKQVLDGSNPTRLANAYTFNGLTQIPTLQVKSVAVTKESIEKELIATGQYKWEQIR